MSTSYNASIVRDGLILALDAGNIKSYPGSGATWTDLSGIGNNSTLVNSPTYSSTNGGSFAFNGTNNYSDMVGNTNTRLQNDQQTLSLWVKINSVGANGEALLWEVYGGTKQTWIAWTPGGVNFWCGSNVTYVGITSANNFSEWMNVVYIINRAASTFTLYKNGVYVNVVSFTAYTPDATTVVFGKNSRTGNVLDYTNGSIANIQLYNRLLTASEVKQNFNALRGRYGI